MKITNNQLKYGIITIILFTTIVIMLVYTMNREPEKNTEWVSDHIGENIDSTKVEFLTDTPLSDQPLGDPFLKKGIN